MIVEDWKKIVKRLEWKIEEEKMVNAKLTEKNLTLSKGKHYNVFILLVLLILIHNLIFLWKFVWFLLITVNLYFLVFIEIIFTVYRTQEAMWR